MSNASNRRNQLKHATKRNNENLSKTERLLEENEMNEIKQQKSTVVETTPDPETSGDPIWMLSVADIRKASPALNSWSNAELMPTIDAVSDELIRAGAVINGTVVDAIDVEEFNRICNSVILELHKSTITEYLEKAIRVDVIEIIGSGLKDPELRTLVDNIVATCYVQNVDPSDGDIYHEILDGFIDPVIDQMAQNVTEVIDGVDAINAQNSSSEAEPITHVESVDKTAVESNLSNGNWSAKRTYTKQPLIAENTVVEKTTDVVKASKVGGQNVTLTAMIDGKEVQVDEVHIRRNMTPYIPDFTMSKVGDSNVAFAAMDEFYVYRGALEKKQILLDILSAVGKLYYNVCDGVDEVYIPMDEVDLSAQLTREEITVAIWGSSHGPFDPSFMLWHPLISVQPKTQSMKLSENNFSGTPPKNLTGVIYA